MSYSLNEIEAMTKKAARGAGYAWGPAEEAGKAVRWLESHGLTGAAALVGHLNIGNIDGPPMSLRGDWSSATGVLCPLTSGAALNDCAEQLADGHIQRLMDVDHPLLILPFAAWAALHIKAAIHVAWDGMLATTDGYRLRYEARNGDPNQSRAAVVSCKMDKAGGDLRAPALRGEISSDVWQALGKYAHRTYAPASEESRLLGAGAGVTDND